MNSDLSFRCSECGKKFQSGAHLSNHLKKPHPPRSLLKKLREYQEVKQVPRKKDSENSDIRESRLPSVELGSSHRTNPELRISSTPPGRPLEITQVQGIWEGREATTINKSIAFEVKNRNEDSRECSDPDHRPNGSNENSDGSGNYGSDSSKASTPTQSESVGVPHPPNSPPPLSNFSIDHAPISTYSGNELHNGSLLRDVFQFYKYFGDESEQMYEDLHERARTLDELPDACKLLVQYCMRCRMSQSEIGRLFQLQLSLENCYELPESAETALSYYFPDAESFVSFVVYERKRLVGSQGWKKAIIINSLGIKQVGVFLPITRVINRVISEVGGIEQIRKFQMRFNRDGKRTFSCPLDSDIMRIETQTWNSSSRVSNRRTVKETPKVFFSMYCDETLLSRSGSQDTAVVRIRVENVAGANLVWHDVGIPPKLEVGNGPISNARRRQAKLELFHRFLFLILEEIAAVNIDNLSTNLGYEPVLLGFVTDQPQERIFLCLKRGNCQQDCSFCCFRSAEDRVLRKRKRFECDEEAGLGHCGSPKKSKLLATSQPAVEKRALSVKSRKASGSNQEGSDFVVENDSDSSISEADDKPPKDNSDAVNGIPIPLYVDRYVPRNVLHTVKMQLQAAVLTRLKTLDAYCFRLQGVNAVDILEPQGLTKRKIMLASEGALPLPPAFGCLKGICSPPFRLYTLPTIDLLHCFDLGPSKQFCDDAFLVLRRAPYTITRRWQSLIRIANQRVSDLPSDTGCHGMRPFKTMDSDRQASYTGKERRLLCPILWNVTMGLSSAVKPDDDPLFKAALYLDFMQAELKGINRSIETRHRTDDQIDTLQELCLEACNHFIHCFDANESTKLHRIMVHLGAHLRGYGNLRISDTAPNETLHKGVKDSYHATNKHQDVIASQILHVNISAEANSNLSGCAAENRLLLTRDPSVITKVGEHSQVARFKRESRTAEDTIAAEVNKFLRTYEQNDAITSPEAVVQSLLSETDGFGRYKYSRKKRVTISAKFEWDQSNEVSVRQTIYSKASTVRDMERFDCVLYRKDGSTLMGMVQAFINRLPTRRESHLSGATVALVRIFKGVEPMEGNRIIVDKFGYSRVAFECVSGDVRIECIPLHTILRRVVMLRDMWDVTLRYGATSRVSNIPDTVTDRASARFFVAKNIQFSSIGEVLLLKTNDESDHEMISGHHNR